MTESSLAFPSPVDPNTDTETTDGTQLDAAQVEQYLLAHPAFLADHPDLLGHLELPALPEGVASLPHYQLRIWRRAIQGLHQEIDALHETARGNAELDRLMHHFAAALLQAGERNAAQLEDVIGQYFQVDQIRLVSWASLTAEEQASLGGWADSGYPLCGRPTDAQRRAVFGEALPETGSAALIGLYPNESGATPRKPSHILGLGRNAPEGFNPDQGTLFLTQIGELAGAFLYGA